METSGRWLCTVVAISTKSKPPSANRWVASSYRRAMPNCSPMMLSRSGSRSQMATMRAPSTSFQPCIWLTAKKPHPISAPLSSAILSSLGHLHQCYPLLQFALSLINDHRDNDDQPLDHHLPER